MLSESERNELGKQFDRVNERRHNLLTLKRLQGLNLAQEAELEQVTEECETLMERMFPVSYVTQQKTLEDFKQMHADLDFLEARLNRMLEAQEKRNTPTNGNNEERSNGHRGISTQAS